MRDGHMAVATEEGGYRARLWESRRMRGSSYATGFAVARYWWALQVL